jgi:hypothetical protein
MGFVETLHDGRPRPESDCNTEKKKKKMWEFQTRRIFCEHIKFSRQPKSLVFQTECPNTVSTIPASYSEYPGFWPGSRQTWPKIFVVFLTVTSQIHSISNYAMTASLLFSISFSLTVLPSDAIGMSLTNPRMNWEELIAYFPSIRQGSHRKWRVQHFFYCWACIRCRSNIVTEPLPSNDKGIHIQTHGQIRGIYKVRCLRWAQVPWYTYKIP